MIERKLLIFNVVAYVLLYFVFNATSSGLLAQLFGATGSPLLFVGVTAHLSLHRNFKEALLWIYISSFIAMAFSFGSIGYFLIGQCAILICVRLVRERVYFPGAFYFTLIFGMSGLVFHLSIALASLALDQNPMPGPHWMAGLYQILWTPVISFPLYYIFQVVDAFTKKASVISEVESL